MTKFGSLIGRKTSNPGNLRAESPEPSDNVIELDQELFSPAPTQVGEENEAVRNLLVDVELRIGELDAVKDVINRLVEPVSKTLRAFEATKSEKLSLQNTLNNTRISHGKLRNELEAVQKRRAGLESECVRLREDLELAQQYVQSLETTKAEQTSELTSRRIEMAEMQRRAQQDTAETQNARDESRRLNERLIACDKKIVQLESDLDTTTQKLTLAERDRASLQGSLDEVMAESGRLSRRLLEAENALTASQARARQFETRLTELEAERSKLTLLHEETKERHQNESNTGRMRLEALQARSTTTEKLLDEARQALATRAEELRTYERRMAEATLMRSTIENKLGQIEAGVAERDAQIRDLEHIRSTLTERNEALAKAATTRENAFNRAQEKIGAQEDRIGLLEAELKALRESSELQIEDLSAQLQRENAERTIAEGALEAARKDVARLLREQAQQLRPASSLDRLPPAPRLQVA